MPAIPLVPDAYLAEADACGLLHRHAGLPYVAGCGTDPATGELQYYVEYCDPALLAAGAALEWLTARVRAEHPGTDLIVVRARDGAELPAPWQRHQTYVRRTGPPPAVSDGVVTVVPAGPEHHDVLLGWIFEALVRAAGERGRPADPAVVRRVAGDVLDTPGRLSYVALYDGRPVGHLTLRRHQRDEVTGEEYVELYDVLVEPAELRKAASAALLATAIGRSDPREPLLGQVHHPDESLAPGHGERILRGLLTSGWAVDHTFWRLTP
ncbi:GNAT family N-acetyltransferase [Streptomyces sp. NPDC101166]|uniref:GNAT family N-acetyltransferase n=1 Tax=Streptomyces sp. NPDC101166 TaxID=3366120 RepID=UPI0038202805